MTPRTPLTAADPRDQAIIDAAGRGRTPPPRRRWPVIKWPARGTATTLDRDLQQRLGKALQRAMWRERWAEWVAAARGLLIAVPVVAVFVLAWAMLP